MNLIEILSKEGVLIVDVREPFEFGMGHARGAVNMPLGSIPSKVEYFRSLGKPVVFYCRSGNRSGQAVGFLKANGIQDIYNGGSVEEVDYYLRRAA